MTSNRAQMVVTEAGSGNGRSRGEGAHRPGEGEILGSGAQQIRILENGEHRLTFAEVTIPPDTPSPSQHRHAQHDEGFCVLAGTLRFTVGEAVGAEVTRLPDAASGRWS